MYVQAKRYLNSRDILNAVYSEIINRELIDQNIYDIYPSFLWKNDEGKMCVTVTCTYRGTNLVTEKTYVLSKDLNICPKTLYNYFIYKFKENVPMGSAIRVVKLRKDEKDLDHFAYNAVVINYNRDQISYVMCPSRGPMTRYVTARDAFLNGIIIYVYESPDEEDIRDNYEKYDEYEFKIEEIL